MDILSCQSRKSAGEINYVNDGAIHAAVHAHSLTWLAVTLNGTKPLLVTPVLVLNMSAVKPINILQQTTKRPNSVAMSSEVRRLFFIP